MEVKIELDKPLVSVVEIDGWKQKVEYEGLPTICYNCGRVGHLNTTCPFLPQLSFCNVTSNNGVQSIEKDSDQSTEALRGHRGEISTISGTTKPIGLRDEDFGPWMHTPQRVRCQPRKIAMLIEPSSKLKGNEKDLEHIEHV